MLSEVSSLQILPLKERTISLSSELFTNMPNLRSLVAPQSTFVTAAVAPSLTRIRRLDLVLNASAQNYTLLSIAIHCVQLKTLIVTVPGASLHNPEALFTTLQCSRSLENLCVYLGRAGSSFEAPLATPFHSLLRGRLADLSILLPPNLKLSQVFCHFFSDNLGFGIMGPYSVPACIFAENDTTIDEISSLLPYLDPNAQLEDYPTPLALILQILFETGPTDAAMVKKFEQLIKLGADPTKYFRMLYRDEYIRKTLNFAVNNLELPSLQPAPLHNLLHLGVQGGVPEILALVFDALGDNFDAQLLFDSAGFSIMHYLRATSKRTEVDCLNLMLRKGYQYLLNHWDNEKHELPIRTSVNSRGATANPQLLELMLSNTQDPWKKSYDGTSLLTDILLLQRLSRSPIVDTLSQEKIHDLLDGSMHRNPAAREVLRGAMSYPDESGTLFRTALSHATFLAKKQLFEELAMSVHLYASERNIRIWTKLEQLLSSGLTMRDLESLEGLQHRFMPLFTMFRTTYSDLLWELQEKYNADLTLVFRDAGGFVNSLLDMIDHHEVEHDFNQQQAQHLIRLHNLFREKQWSDDSGIECRLAGAAALWVAIIKSFPEVPQPKSNKLQTLKLLLETFQIVSKGLVEDAFPIASLKLPSALDMAYLLCSPCAFNCTLSTAVTDRFLETFLPEIESLPQKAVSIQHAIDTLAKYKEEGLLRTKQEIQQQATRSETPLE